MSAIGVASYTSWHRRLLRMLASRLALVAVIVPALAGGLQAADEAGADLVKLVVNLLGEKDKDLRAVGLEQVRSDAKGADATRQFAAQLPKLPAESQVALLGALADRGDAAARPALLALLDAAPPEPVFVAALAALGPLGEPTDLTRLIAALSAPSKARQAAARASLVNLRGEAVPALIANELKAAPAALRIALVEILVARHARQAVGEILPLSVDKDPAVRMAAMSALGQMAGGEQITAMLPGVLKAEKGAEREAAEKCVMFACARTSDPERRAEPVLAGWGGLSPADRLTVLPTLGRVGGSAVLAIVEAAIADSDAQRHAAGIRALCNWPDAAIAPRLIELVRSDDHPEHRTLALAALTRVAPLPDKRSGDEKLEVLKTAMSLSTRDEERNQVLRRASAVRTLPTLHFIVSYLDEPACAQQACESIVEMAHHREFREPNKAEFDMLLDQVIAKSQDPVVVDRAGRYQKGQTWVRPKAGAQP